MLAGGRDVIYDQGLADGCFDPIHEGHIAYLAAAAGQFSHREHGDRSGNLEKRFERLDR